MPELVSPTVVADDGKWKVENKERAIADGSLLSTIHHPLSTTGHPLEVFFRPKSIAVIGASDREGSIGKAIVSNLFAHDFGASAAYRCRVFAVNPTHKMVAGRPAFACLADIPEQIELAMIVTPAATVPDIISECVQAGVRGAIVISAGFREHGEPGKALEREITRRIRGHALGALHSDTRLELEGGARV